MAKKVQASFTAEQLDTFLDSGCDITSADADTWRQWFGDCLIALCEDGEGFSGKRPNCDSDWQHWLAAGLSRLQPKCVEKWEQEDDGSKFPDSIRWHYVNETARAVVRHLCGMKA